MQSKLKHKTTIMDPAQFQGMIVNRSQRRNKTMLKTYKNSKDQNSSQNYADQKQAKTLVEGKIEELHRKMKEFFTDERKTHLQQIAPDMQSLMKMISQLRQQLNRPKSMQEIQKEKHELFRRKVRILQEIQKINKELKVNKKEFFDMKLSSDQVQRQVNNALATLKKYRHKMDKKTSNDKAQQENSQDTLKVSEDRRDSSSMYRILNDSLLQQNNSSQQHQSQRASFQHLHKRQNSISSNGNDHIHITEVQERQDSKYKLPFIKNKSALIGADDKSTKLKNKFTQIESCRNSRLIKKSINSNPLGSNTQGHKSTTSFASILNPVDTITHSNLSYSNLNSQFFNPKPKKSIPFDLSLQLHKYQQLVNKQKWTEVQKLFTQVDDMDVQYKLKVRNGIKSTVKSSSPANNLSEILMDQLRKVQFASYKQKGYHQGLKDKTYQIKIQIKNIFKNFSPDQFFSKALNKKAVQKQLLKILQNSVQG